MSNVHSPDKEPLSQMIPRTLMARLKREARNRNQPWTEYVIALLTTSTLNVELTPEDYEDIAKATREARNTKRRLATRFRFAARAKR